MDRTTILELAETEIPAAARDFADAVAEPLLKQIADQIDERVAAWFGELSMDEIEGDVEMKIASDLIQPAFAMHVTDQLSLQLRDACAGWRGVFWTNMAERYSATGEV